MVIEFGEIMRTEVGQFVMFPVTPDVLHRVKLRRIARQLGDREPAILGSDEFAHQDGSMGGQSVPHHQQLAPQLPQQVAEKINYLRGANRTLIEAEIEVPPSDASCSREHFPIEMILQHRSLPARCPGPYPMRSFAQPAFIDKHDQPLFAEGFFLMRGHATRFQRRIACSSRSSARPLGRWQLQLSLRRIRHTCEGLYRTWYCCSISLRTRASVHSPVAYPNTSGPALSVRSTSASCCTLNLGLRPARSAFFSPARPTRASARCQRITDWRWTPRRRATSLWLMPASNKRAASIRRCSNSSKSRRTPAGFPINSRLAYVSILFKSHSWFEKTLALFGFASWFRRGQ